MRTLSQTARDKALKATLEHWDDLEAGEVVTAENELQVVRTEKIPEGFYILASLEVQGKTFSVGVYSPV